LGGDKMRAHCRGQVAAPQLSREAGREQSLLP
jgi:hypothetical protein